MGWLLKAVEAVLLLTAGLWFILLGMQETGRLVVILSGCLVVLILAALLSFLTGSVKGGQAKRRIKAMGEGFDEESFEKAGDCLYIGNNWLVYRRKEDWLFWRKDKVDRIVIRDHNGLGTRADIVVYLKGMYAGETIHVNALNYDLLNKIENWPYADSSADELTETVE